MRVSDFLEHPDQVLHMVLVVQVLPLNFRIRADPICVTVAIVGRRVGLGHQVPVALHHISVDVTIGHPMAVLQLQHEHQVNVELERTINNGHVQRVRRPAAIA